MEVREEKERCGDKGEMQKKEEEKGKEESEKEIICLVCKVLFGIENV
jgi:hypothetical protein